MPLNKTLQIYKMPFNKTIVSLIFIKEICQHIPVSAIYPTVTRMTHISKTFITGVKTRCNMLPVPLQRKNFLRHRKVLGQRKFFKVRI